MLSNAELLAIIIGSGSAEESAVDLMKRLLADCKNNLNTLGKMSLEELCKYKGIGKAKAISILAACELGKRRQKEKAEERADLSAPCEVYDYMRPVMQDLDVEEAWVLLMNQNLRLIKAVRLSHGGLTETAVDVRIIMHEAIVRKATVLTLVHNHPSNNPSPSKDDDRITTRIKQACDIMRIHMADHIIIVDGGYYSYHEMGRL